MMKIKPYTPRTRQVFWCNECDCYQVDSEKPETGFFSLRFGHQFDHTTKEYDGDYVGVMFAICKDCAPPAEFPIKG